MIAHPVQTHNQMLSEKRANSVPGALPGNGLSPPALPAHSGTFLFRHEHPLPLTSRIQRRFFDIVEHSSAFAPACTL
jgi:hypothetical protein